MQIPGTASTGGQRPCTEMHADVTANRYQRAVLYVLVALVYFFTARLGLSFATVGRSISLVWPATGLSLGLMIVHGRRIWPGILVGAFLANAVTPGVSIPSAFGIAVGNTLEAVVGALALERAEFRPALSR